MKELVLLPDFDIRSRPGLITFNENLIVEDLSNSGLTGTVSVPDGFCYFGSIKSAGESMLIVGNVKGCLTLL